MKKKILFALLLAAGVAVPASRALAQKTDIVEGHFRIHFTLDGHIYCEAEGTDC